MSFDEVIESYCWEAIQKEICSRSRDDVEKALDRERPGTDDLLSLLSPSAEPLLEEMAQRAHSLTQQRFGKVISLFAPLYLSNVCTNSCAYCGFNARNPVERLTLAPEQIGIEAKCIRDLGFRHILLVCGEAPATVGTEYMLDALEVLDPFFASISIEFYPMPTKDYGRLIAHGVDGLTIFQETYNEKRYAEVHVGGKKRDYRWRLETPDRGGEAGFRRIGIGALLGLDDWRMEGFFLALHALYLQRRFWKSQMSISFPRLRPAAGGYQPMSPVSDRHLVHLLAALRLVLPDVGFTLSTREPADLRDHLIPIGITSMSAGSRTDPGGYTHQAEAGAQFEIADERSPETVAEVIKEKGYEPVWKDWDGAFLR
jgi:2-iminoacetate synthase